MKILGWGQNEGGNEDEEKNDMKGWDVRSLISHMCYRKYSGSILSSLKKCLISLDTRAKENTPSRTTMLNTCWRQIFTRDAGACGVGEGEGEGL